MKTGDSLNELNKSLELYQEALKIAELKLNSTMEDLSKNVHSKEFKKVQKVFMKLNIILNKAKKGENVDKEIKVISKEFKQDK